MLLSFELSAEHAQRLRDAMCGLFHYQERVLDNAVPGEDQKKKMVPNPESREVFAKRKLCEILQSHVLRWEQLLAKKNAGKTIGVVDITGGA